MAVVAVTALLLLSANAGGGADGSRLVEAGHDLSIRLPPGGYLTHRRFTPCTDPVERFSVISGGEILMLQERVDARGERSPQRPRTFRVAGKPTGIECCSIARRVGWVIAFRDHGRAFYAYLYPRGTSPMQLLNTLNSLRVRRT
jgi:hypothetical protein